MSCWPIEQLAGAHVAGDDGLGRIHHEDREGHEAIGQRPHPDGSRLDGRPGMPRLSSSFSCFVFFVFCDSVRNIDRSNTLAVGGALSIRLGDLGGPSFACEPLVSRASFRFFVRFVAFAVNPYGIAPCGKATCRPIRAENCMATMRSGRSHDLPLTQWSASERNSAAEFYFLCRRRASAQDRSANAASPASAILDGSGTDS
jgi:hypothetical protein